MGGWLWKWLFHRVHFYRREKIIIVQANRYWVVREEHSFFHGLLYYVFYFNAVINYMNFRSILNLKNVKFIAYGRISWSLGLKRLEAF